MNVYNLKGNSKIKRIGYQKICAICEYMIIHPKALIKISQKIPSNKYTIPHGKMTTTGIYIDDKKQIDISKVLVKCSNSVLRTLYDKSGKDMSTPNCCIRTIDKEKYYEFREKYKHLG